MDLEPHSLDPVVERTCAECGAKLTGAEIQAVVENGGAYLCTVHALEEVPLEDEDEPVG
ncbi:MAG: hypothetical protein QOG63_1839 [Thermoleophilaceae bacterium]|jgi:hypothetical protein|nr:hypothetical protein [Thermoleophilaceae bacterium]